MTRGDDGLTLPGFLVLACAALSGAPSAQLGTVRSEQKISAFTGGFGGVLAGNDRFGSGVGALGDLDGDGIGDVAVGIPQGDGASANQGVVWVFLLNADGTIKAEQKLTEGAGGFGGTLGLSEEFGTSLASLGDLDADGVLDLAVGASHSSDGDTTQGAVWILFLNTDGTVKGQQKISEIAGGFTGVLDPLDYFGEAVAGLGDLDGDGHADLAVGAFGDDDGEADQGAVWILFLNADGTVKAQQKITETEGGFTGQLESGDGFGFALASPGDVDGDGTLDLAVGALQDDDGGLDKGAVWILFLNADGTVKGKQKISATSGLLGDVLHAADQFGSSVGALGDFDRDGHPDLAVGAMQDRDGAAKQGAVWILFLGPDGKVKGKQKISELAGGFGGALDREDLFGRALACLGDLDGDGAAELAVGTPNDDDGGANQGALWVLFLEGDATPPTIHAPPIVTVIDNPSQPGEFVFFDVTASDAVDPTPFLVCVPPSGSYFSRGTTWVTCIATDATGNTSILKFPVVVQLPIRPRRL
jgi:hypothetical protein